MKKQLLCLGCLLLCATVSFCQAKPKTPVKKPLSELNRLLTGSGLPYKMVNDSLVVIPYEGENIASYQVVIQKVSDLFIVYTNLTEVLPIKIDETKYKYLLQQNDHFDIVKIGMSASDEILYLRADVYRAGTNAVLLKRVIEQVANVTNILGGELR